MSNDEKESSKEDEQMICALTADEMVALREGPSRKRARTTDGMRALVWPPPL